MADTLAEVADVVSARVRFDTQALRDLCRRSNVRRLSLYGSVLRQDFGPQSDVDVLAEFEPGFTPSLLGLGGLLLDLEDLFGREVDLKTPGDFPDHILAGVKSGTRVLYAAG